MARGGVDYIRLHIVTKASIHGWHLQLARPAVRPLRLSLANRLARLHSPPPQKKKASPHLNPIERPGPRVPLSNTPPCPRYWRKPTALLPEPAPKRLMMSLRFHHYRLQMSALRRGRSVPMVTRELGEQAAESRWSPWERRNPTNLLKPSCSFTYYCLLMSSEKCYGQYYSFCYLEWRPEKTFSMFGLSSRATADTALKAAAKRRRRKKYWNSSWSPGQKVS